MACRVVSITSRFRHFGTVRLWLHALGCAWKLLVLEDWASLRLMLRLTEAGGSVRLPFLAASCPGPSLRGFRSGLASVTSGGLADKRTLGLHFLS